MPKTEGCGVVNAVGGSGVAAWRDLPDTAASVIGGQARKQLAGVVGKVSKDGLWRHFGKKPEGI